MQHAGMHTPPDHGSLNPTYRYRRHEPETTALYPIVEQHLSTFRDELQHPETSLPRFVLTEFQDYLRCGRLEYGFVRVKCNGCRHEHPWLFRASAAGSVRPAARGA
jgi:hypothetical protein